jgi:hypothetical protein
MDKKWYDFAFDVLQVDDILGFNCNGAVFLKNSVAIKVNFTNDMHEAKLAEYIKHNFNNIFPIIYNSGTINNIPVYIREELKDFTTKDVERDKFIQSILDSIFFCELTNEDIAINENKEKFINRSIAKYLNFIQNDKKDSFYIFLNKYLHCLKSGFILQDITFDNIGLNKKNEIVIRDFGECYLKDKTILKNITLSDISFIIQENQEHSFCF